MCKSVWAWLMLVTVAGGIPDEQQYCTMRYRRLCLGKGPHVACQYPDSPGESCQHYTKIKFKSDLRYFITNYINRRRQRIALGNERVRGGAHLPKPQIMMLVSWDRELARLAQRLADQCQFLHDSCRATVKYPFAGQAVGEVRWRRSNSESDELSAQRGIRRVLDAWWGERRRALVKEVIAPFKLTAKGTVWGHFSQLAVWNLQAVGCGAVRHGANHPRLLLVCDFSHTNMLGQKTIVPGPTEPCPTNTARRSKSAYPALCGPFRNPSSEYKEMVDYEEDEEEDMETTGVKRPGTSLAWIRSTDLETMKLPSITTERSSQTNMNPQFFKPAEATARDVITENVDRECNIDRSKSNDIDRDVQRDPERAKFREIDRVIQKVLERGKPMNVYSQRELEKSIERDIKIEMDRYMEKNREKFGHKENYEREKNKEVHYREKARWRDQDIEKNRGREEEGRNKAVLKQSTDWPDKERTTINSFNRFRFLFKQTTENPSREAEIEDSEMETTVKEFQRRIEQLPELMAYHPTKHSEDASNLESGNGPRLSWKHTIQPLQRPGANGLSYTTTQKPIKKLVIQPGIRMDKEDIEQLFLDTGFTSEWKKST